MLRVIEKRGAGDKPQLARDLSDLGLVLFLERKYADAESPLKRALELNEKFQGTNSVAVASSLNQLAEVYRIQGKYAEAEPLYKRALVIDEALPDLQHAVVPRDLRNLATLYSLEGRYSDAEPLLQRLLTIKEAAVGPDSPQLVPILDSYVIVLRVLGCDDEAKTMAVRADALRSQPAKKP
jgi:tetratricopeptide (TPR) repeat protein